MPTVTGAFVKLSRGAYRMLWETITTTNADGAAWDDEKGCPVFSDKCVQVIGTFGAAATLEIQGSNDGGTTWVVLTDPQGNNLSFTAAGMEQILENPRAIRPELVSGGDGSTDIDVYIVGRGVMQKH